MRPVSARIGATTSAIAAAIAGLALVGVAAASTHGLHDAPPMVAAPTSSANADISDGAASSRLEASPTAADPTDRTAWTTVAGGDEVLALAIDPGDPNRLWAGTEGGGVVVWDLRSKSFEQHSFPDPTGPAGNVVWDIAFDPDGTAWLATSEGVTQATGGLWAQFGVASGLQEADVRAVAAAPDGTVWAGGPAGIASRSPGAEAWQVYEVVPYKPRERLGRDGPGFGPVVDIAVDQRGDVWLAHGRGGSEDRPALSIYRVATGKWDHVAATLPGGAPEEGPPTEQVMALAFDADTDRLWAGTWGRGAVYYDGRRRAWRHPAADGLCSSFVWSIAASQGAAWAGCGDDWRGRGVARWNGSDWESWSAADGLPTDVVGAIAIAGGQVWLGTNGPGPHGRGIVAFDRARGEVGATLSTFPAAPASNDITAILVDPHGTAWVGTRGAGLMERRRASAASRGLSSGRPPTEEPWELHTRTSSDGRLAGDTITDLAWRDGELWVASTQTQLDGKQFVDGGVSRYDPAARAWRTPITRPATGPGLPDNDVSSLAVDAGGRVWIGTGAAVGGPASPDANHAGNGLAVFDPAAGTWTVYRFDRNAPRALAGDTVLDVVATADGVWAAASYHHDGADLRSHGGGVSVLRAGTWTGWGNGDDGLRTWSGKRGAPGSTAFITGDVRALSAGARTGIWAGTWTIEGEGSVIERWPAVDAAVNRWDGGAWRADVFPSAGWVAALAEDPSGRLWAGTTRGHDGEEIALNGEPRAASPPPGLYVRAGGAWTALDPTTSGVASRAVSALAVDPATGDVWVGGENGGLSVFSPQLPTPTPPPTAPPTATPSPPPTSCAACGTPTRTAGSGTPAATSEPSPTARVGAASTTLFLPWTRQWARAAEGRR